MVEAVIETIREMIIMIIDNRETIIILMTDKSLKQIMNSNQEGEVEAEVTLFIILNLFLG